MLFRLLLCVTLVGCGLQNAAPSPLTPQDPFRAAVAGTTHLYVWNESVPPAELDEYPTAGGRPALRISSPLGLFSVRSTIDGNGALYMVGGTPYAPNVSVYKPGAAKPFQAIVKGVGQVIGLATDATNDLYVLNGGGPLVKYAPGATEPAFATYSGLCATSYGGPAVLAADRAGNVYVGANCGKGTQSHAVVAVYAGGTKPKRTISLDPSLHAIGFTVDKSGRVYVAYADASNKYRLGLAEYDVGTVKPVRSFYFGPSSSADEVNAGVPVVDDATGMLYQTYSTCSETNAMLQCSSSIALFPRGAIAPSRTLSGPADAVLGTPVLDADGNLYVEVESPRSPLVTIARYAKGTWTRTKVLSNRKLFLAFAWPTVASSRASLEGTPVNARRTGAHADSGCRTCVDSWRERLP